MCNMELGFDWIFYVTFSERSRSSSFTLKSRLLLVFVARETLLTGEAWREERREELEVEAAPSSLTEKLENFLNLDRRRTSSLSPWVPCNYCIITPLLILFFGKV